VDESATGRDSADGMVIHRTFYQLAEVVQTHGFPERSPEPRPLRFARVPQSGRGACRVGAEAGTARRRTGLTEARTGNGPEQWARADLRKTGHAAKITPNANLDH
jgi:hypothetical protein